MIVNKMDATQVKLVIFDADHTLLDFSKCEAYALNKAFEELGLTLDESILKTFSDIDRTLWETGSWQTQLVSYHDIPRERFRLLFEVYNLGKYDYDHINKQYMMWFSKASFPLIEAATVIKKLYDRKIKVCIATNGLVQLQYPRLLNADFGQYITQIVASEEVLKAKPHPDIFLKILSDQNVKAYEALVVGDSLIQDVLGAQNAGIQAIWFNPSRKTNVSNIKPDYMIQSLLDIVYIIDQIQERKNT